MEEAHDTESVSNCHDDDVGILLDEIGAVKQVYARTAALPYVQIQAVLTH